MTNRQKSALWAAIAGLSLWLTISSLSLSSELPYFEHPVAGIYGNTIGNFTETGRLLTRWQTEGGMETSLETLVAIPWGASLVLIEGDRSYDIAIDLIYIGETGPDYPLMYAKETVLGPTSLFQAFLEHEWTLSGEWLQRFSWKSQFTDLYRVIAAGVFSFSVSLLLYSLAGVGWKK